MRPPDLLVVDLHLPDMSGVAVCTQLRSTRTADRAVVVATSAHADPEDLEALRLLGFVRYYPKGAQLAAAVPGLMRTAQRQAVLYRPSSPPSVPPASPR